MLEQAPFSGRDARRSAIEVRAVREERTRRKLRTRGVAGSQMTRSRGWLPGGEGYLGWEWLPSLAARWPSAA